jgi:hypothetical protein
VRQKNVKRRLGYEIVRIVRHVRYYFHILTDRERLRDPDGEEFASLTSVREQAKQNARDLIAEELRCGCAAPSAWRIHIALEDDTIVETVPFTALLLGHEERCAIQTSHQEQFSHAMATFAKAQNANAEITHHIVQLRANLNTLAELNKRFTQHLRD